MKEGINSFEEQLPKNQLSQIQYLEIRPLGDIYTGGEAEKGEQDLSHVEREKVGAMIDRAVSLIPSDKEIGVLSKEVRFKKKGREGDKENGVEVGSITVRLNDGTSLVWANQNGVFYLDRRVLLSEDDAGFRAGAYAWQKSNQQGLPKTEEIISNEKQPQWETKEEIIAKIAENGCNKCKQKLEVDKLTPWNNPNPDKDSWSVQAYTNDVLHHKCIDAYYDREAVARKRALGDKFMGFYD